MSINEAAALLGKSPRTVRWMAQQGRLAARRVGGRWVIDGDQVEAASPGLADSRRLRAAEVGERLSKALAEAMPPGAGQRKRGFYSVRDMATWQLATEVVTELEAFRVEHPEAAGALEAAGTSMGRFMRHLADGCHQFHPQTKLDRFIRARTEACHALAEVLRAGTLHPALATEALAERIEHELLGRLRGVLRRVERRQR